MSDPAPTKKVARLANLPPAPPPIARSSSERQRRGDGGFNPDDEDEAASNDEDEGDSDFDEATVNTGGNSLADNIQAKLDEREFEDDNKRQQRLEDGQEAEQIEEIVGES